MLSDHFQITFLHVESIALRLKKGRDYKDSAYIEQVFNEIEKEVRRNLVHNEELIFEATGLTDAFDSMLLRLQKDFNVKLINVRTKPELCLSRVKTRDSSQQVKVSEEDVMAINIRSVEKKFAFDGNIDNNHGGKEEIITSFEGIMHKQDRSDDESQTQI